MSDRLDAEEFIAGFLVEAGEHLQAANATLLAVEVAVAKGQGTPRQVRELFRSLHTIKGLSAMVGIEPIVEIAHAMETVLREADRAAGKLPAGSVEPLLQGVRAIEQRVQALSRRKPIAAAPASLIETLGALRPSASAAPPPAADLSLDADLLAKLDAAEREQLIAGMKGGRRGIKVEFFPTPERAREGVNITVVRERLGAVAEIVKVLPRAVPTSDTAPGGLVFVLLVLTAAGDDAVAAAGGTTIDRLSPLLLRTPPPAALGAADGLDDGPPEEPVAGDERGRGGIVRVDVARLDDALEKLSALVITRFRLGRVVAAMGAAGVDIRPLAQIVHENARQLRDLRASIMRARMVPVSELLERVPLLVRGLARATGKLVRLEIQAGKAELDKAVADRIFPAIVHLVRNAVDHALEMPDDRRRAGKLEAGLVRVSCIERSDNQLELQVSDDGRGIDRVAVAARAGVDVPGSDDALLALLARPGLSTKTEVTTTSGRGVGMDIVRRITVEDLGGELSLATTPGAGTTFTVRIPLSITIVDAFSFVCGGETFVVPVAMVEEIQEVDLGRVVRGPDRRKVSRGGSDRRQGLPPQTTMLDRRGEAVPVVPLDELFGLPPAADPRRKAIVVRRNGDPFAFAVDRMLGQQEVVVRPLEDALVMRDGIAGTTDLGDGRPTLVLDLAALGGKLTASTPGAAR